MNFINPYILFGLVAVAVPILLHILNLQKVQKIEFSTLMFLKEVQKSRFRKIRIKQWPLMLVRILIIMALVLTFADLFTDGYSPAGTSVRKLGIIFTDSSFSMDVKSGNDTLLRDAMGLADEIQGLYSSSDEVKMYFPKVSDGFDSVMRFSQNIKPYLSGILIKADEESGIYNYPVKEVFVISDFQKINYDAVPSEIKNTETFYYFINVSDKVYPDLSVNILEALTKIPEPSRPMKFRAAVKNYSNNSITDARLDFYADNVKKDEKIFNLAPQERKEIDFTVNPGKSGYLKTEAKLEVADRMLDALEQDNSMTEVLYIPENIKIGIVCRQTADAERIKAVFDAANRITGNGKIYDYTLTGKVNGLDDYDAVYICGFEKFSREETDEIRKYLKSGRGIFIFPSENSDIDSYNSLGNFRISGKINPEEFIPISEINSESPLFEGVFRDAGRKFSESDFEKIKIKRQYQLNTSENAISLVRLQNGLPLIIELKSEDGPLLFSAVSSGDDMSDFSKHALFPPVLLKSAGYMSLIKTLEKRNTDYINHDTLESIAEKISDSKLKEIVVKSGVKNFEIIGSPKDLSDIKNIIGMNRRGKSYWLYTLFAALLLTAVEIFLVKKVYRETN